mmetsp:Transcript_60455/g.128144  ORF Transcript_60455/g.128144 Transcript_60455/m.128144 type:complete len:544 (+) Transcript_60455:47-1678(+)|eukprot:CAMPEP_0206560676 /NCGR_PEP_ID=MMETSP0325_2-20121206/21148_1 /ASSEMBLY_ACC=CAM_ASM_000347 /TAXON_ID=2866 /ORGANISM="Crypthecodinium cohnii, Strain Seligo" /LENGTH=543 /DNA_ID=CAMNT_0054062447 /DNA_START=44 /DNA_END=1675 /DNA_ORIENTATION=-
MSGQANEAVVSCREKGDKIVLVFNVQNVKPASVKADFSAIDEGGLLNIHFGAISPTKNYFKELAIPHAINDGKIVHEVQNKCLTILLPKVDANLSWGTAWSKGKDQNKLKAKVMTKLSGADSETKAEPPTKDKEAEPAKGSKAAEQPTTSESKAAEVEKQDSPAPEQKGPKETPNPIEAKPETKKEPPTQKLEAKETKNQPEEAPQPSKKGSQETNKPAEAKAKAKAKAKAESTAKEAPSTKAESAKEAAAKPTQKTPAAEAKKQQETASPAKANSPQAAAKPAEAKATPKAKANATNQAGSKKTTKASEAEKDTPSAGRQTSQDSTKSSEATTAGALDRPETPSTDEEEPTSRKGATAKCCSGTWTKSKDTYKLEAVLPSLEKFDEKSLTLKDGRISLTNAKKQLVLDSQVPAEADNTRYSSAKWADGKKTLTVIVPLKCTGPATIDLDGAWYVEDNKTLVATISKTKLQWSTGERADIHSDRQTNKVALLDSKGKPEFSAMYLAPDTLHWSDGDVWQLKLAKKGGAPVWPDVYKLRFDELD